MFRQHFNFSGTAENLAWEVTQIRIKLDEKLTNMSSGTLPETLLRPEEPFLARVWPSACCKSAPKCPASASRASPRATMKAPTRPRDASRGSSAGCAEGSERGVLAHRGRQNDVPVVVKQRFRRFRRPPDRHAPTEDMTKVMSDMQFACLEEDMHAACRLRHEV